MKAIVILIVSNLLLLQSNLAQDYSFPLDSNTLSKVFPTNGNDLENLTDGSMNLFGPPNSVNVLNGPVGIKCFPNPSDDVLNISYSLPLDYALFEIFSISGALIERMVWQLNTGEMTVNTSNYENGLYFSVLRSPEKVIAVSRFSILHL